MVASDESLLLSQPFPAATIEPGTAFATGQTAAVAVGCTIVENAIANRRADVVAVDAASAVEMKTVQNRKAVDNRIAAFVIEQDKSASQDLAVYDR